MGHTGLMMWSCQLRSSFFYEWHWGKLSNFHMINVYGSIREAQLHIKFVNYKQPSSSFYGTAKKRVICPLAFLVP